MNRTRTIQGLALAALLVALGYLGATRGLSWRRAPTASASAAPSQTNASKSVQSAARVASVSPVAVDGIWKVPVLKDDPKRGAAEPLVTIVEFGDFECSSTKDAEGTLAKLLEAYPSDLRWVWKDCPRGFHSRAVPAALLARRAYNQKCEPGFNRARELLFAGQSKLDDERLLQMAQQLGIPWQGGSGIASAVENQKVDENLELAFNVEAKGTPHFFINGVRLAGAQPFETFKAIVEAELTKARALVAQGIARSDLYERIIGTGRQLPSPELKAIPVVERDCPVTGVPNAKVVVQSWVGLGAPNSCPAIAGLRRLIEESHGRVRWLWRFAAAGDTNEQLAQQALEEVFVQQGIAAFWTYHERITEGEPGIGRFARERLERVAVTVGVDLPRFKDALNRQRHQRRISADAKLAEQLGLSSTPAYLVGGYAAVGDQSLFSLQRLAHRAWRDTSR